MKILIELEKWLKEEKKSYKHGEMMSLSESIIGENIINQIIKKIEELKITMPME
jgi:hypothetical protein